MAKNADEYLIYKDIQERTKGEIYLAVVGPVRTGKSTFIKRFMDVLVLPNMTDVHSLERARDELPQSGAGKMIMTTEPKFIPQEAVEIKVAGDVEMQVRLCDCVGYVIEGAAGYIEGGVERMVKTPWMEHAIPFTQAATIGTKKVIHDHATVGIVVTTDGTIGNIERKNYVDAERQTIEELQSIGKPFVVLVNSQKPYSEEAKSVASTIEDAYGVVATPINCAQLKEEDIQRIMVQLLYEFPVSEVQFLVPKWLEMLGIDHEVKLEVLEHVRGIMDEMTDIRHAMQMHHECSSAYIDKIEVQKIHMDTGCVKVSVQMKEQCYYEILSQLTGTSLENEYDLIGELKQLATLKCEYQQVQDALRSVKMKGYGVVTPQKQDIVLEEPVIIKQGNKYGVKIHSSAPSIHFIRANIETEIAPIVGSEAQAEDLVQYIKENAKTDGGIWDTNIFGKSIENLVEDGIRSKITTLTEESQVKLQDTMQKVVNDSNGGMVCIII